MAMQRGLMPIALWLGVREYGGIWRHAYVISTPALAVLYQPPPSDVQCAAYHHPPQHFGRPWKRGKFGSTVDCRSMPLGIPGFYSLGIFDIISHSNHNRPSILTPSQPTLHGSPRSTECTSELPLRSASASALLSGTTVEPFTVTYMVASLAIATSMDLSCCSS